jgi:hypothetical protein
MRAPSYSKNLETLMAVVTHLGVHKWAVRQSKGIANDLSIDVKDVTLVLESFKGLFRKSPGLDHYYSLHLRFARLTDGENNTKERLPLEAEYLIPLLEFISRKAGEESQRGTAMTAALITASLSLLASMISIVLTIVRTR